MKYFSSIILVFVFWFDSSIIYAQKRYLTIDSIFVLADQNSKQLDISKYRISVQENATKVEKNEIYLPELNTGFSVGYLSNAHVWDNKLNYESTVLMPHTTVNFSLSAGYALYNGGANKNKIEKSKLEEKVAHLDYEKEREDIQFLLIAKYLDLYALYNQEKVFIQNIELAKKRITNIQKLIQQGMLTHNDLVRSQLQLTEIEFQLEQVRNNIKITNHDLNLVLNLPAETQILMDSTLYENLPRTPEDSVFSENLLEKIPELRIASMHSKIAAKDIEITKASRLPKMSLYAGDNIARPFLYTIPPVDIYMHYFQVGVKVSYDIGSLYKSKNQIQKAQMNYTLSTKNDAWLQQKVEMTAHTAYVKMEESWQKFNSENESYNLAVDNYRVVEQKYLNKFAVITDMLDASTTLLSTQINVNNAKAGILYQYFYFLKSTGKWERISPNKE